MALRFVDSFDHYDNAHLNEKWTSSNLGSGSGLLAAAARISGTGKQGCRLGQGNWIQKSITQRSGWTVGFAVRFGDLYDAGALTSFHDDPPLLTFVDGNTGQVALTWNSGGYLGVWVFTSAYDVWTYGSYDGVQANRVGIASQPIRPGVWNYVEIQVVFSTTVGQVTLRVNGVTVLDTAANLNTAISGNAWADGMALLRSYPFAATSSNTNIDIDDFYVADGSGTVNTGFLGDVRVEALLPADVGATTQFAVTGAATNYAAVNNNPPDDDTSYVSSGTAGQQDLYKFSAPSTLGGAVLGIQFNHFARKDDAGTRTIEGLVHTGSTTAAGPQSNPGTSYQDLTSILETNPANGGAAF